MTLLNTFANLGLVTFERTNNAHVLDSSPVQMPNLATLAPASTDERDAADEILDTPPDCTFSLGKLSARPRQVQTTEYHGGEKNARTAL